MTAAMMGNLHGECSLDDWTLALKFVLQGASVRSTPGFGLHKAMKGCIRPS